MTFYDNHKFIIDPNNYRGNCIDIMDLAGKISCSNLSFDDFNQSRGGQLLALSWDEYSTNWRKPFEEILQNDWKETTEEKYYEMFEVLPPLKYRLLNGFDTFFCAEAETGTLHQMFVSKDGKFWTALRDIHRTCERLYLELSKLS